MRKFKVTGMSCAACSSRVEKAVSAVEGVESCSVSLLTNSMGVEGSATDEAVIEAVRHAGYGAQRWESGGEKKASAPAEKEMKAEQNEALHALIGRLISSCIFLVLLMYVSMGHHMWGWWLPSFFAHNHVATALLQMILAGIILIINRRFFVSGVRGALHGAPNMDTLVALGAGVAYGYSVFNLFAMTGAQAEGDMTALIKYADDLYFEASAMILTLITVGKTLETYSKGRTTDALRGLMKLAPKVATLIRDGKEVEVPVEQVNVGDVFVVRPGGSIPVDGVVLEGTGSVNESALTGESIPADKVAGDRVSAGTVNLTGYLTCRSVRVGEDTTLSQIIRMVSDAAATKAPVARVADKVSGIFVPIVLGIAVVTVVIWLAVGRSVGFALARAISVLVISCPCALGLATPVAIMVGNGVGARNGILFKTSAALEMTGRCKIAVLDKTGTVTAGVPEVTDVLPAAGVEERELLGYAYRLERLSEHPLAGAVVRRAEAQGLTPGEGVTDFRALAGNGLEAECEGKTLSGGNLALIAGRVAVPDAVRQELDRLAEQGKTPMLFAHGERFLGVIAVADAVREDSAEAIAQLKDMGLRVIMLTGDNQRTALAVGKQAGVDEVIAGVLPQEKEEVIRKLQEHGKTIMTGDGINDAPALTRADVGIAIGAGTDVAIDAADVVLVRSRLSDLCAAVRLSRATLRNIHENLFWAFIYNVIGIPLAAGAWIGLLGWEMNPMFGAAAMSLSSVCVVTNALRLNLVSLKKKTRKKKDPEVRTVLSEEFVKKEKEEMSENKVTLHIKGMMCPHCEMTVRNALEAIDGVQSADVSHTEGRAVVTLSAKVPTETLKKAVEGKGYQVTEA